MRLIVRKIRSTKSIRNEAKTLVPDRNTNIDLHVYTFSFSVNNAALPFQCGIALSWKQKTNQSASHFFFRHNCFLRSLLIFMKWDTVPSHLSEISETECRASHRGWVEKQTAVLCLMCRRGRLGNDNDRVVLCSCKIGAVNCAISAQCFFLLF